MSRIVVGTVISCACALSLPVLVRPPELSKGDAVISGIVRDDQHAPVARARVQAFPAQDARAASDNLRRLSSGSASTDGTGRFRIPGLPPGDYVVVAEAMPTFPSGGPLPLRVWGPTFYPSTLEVSQAVSITATNQAPASVQIDLVPVTPVRVTGTVITASGRSAQGFDVSLFRSFGGFGGGGPVTSVGPTGAFEIPRVPPGIYELTVAPHATEAGQEGREFVDRMIDVTDRDVDLSLTAGAGASLTGRVIVEPAGVVTTPIGLRITASHDSAHGAFAPDRSIYAAVNADWSFSMTGLSGWYDFSARSDREPDVVATRVVVDGTSSAKPSGIALAEGRHEVVVYLAPRDVAGPAINPRLTPAELVGQFKNEKLFFKQAAIGQAIVDAGDRGVLPALADWLSHPDRHIRGNVALIFAKLGDPRGLQTIADILSDRSERPEGHGIPTASGDGRYHFERQVAADRYYAAHLLGDLRDPLGVDLLVPLLDDPETQSIVPWSLAQIGDRRAIPSLIAALDKDDPSMRVLVIYALETLHATEAVPRLRVLVNDDRKSRFGALVSVSEAAKAAIARLQ
jgi:carboxypeptidase family protein/HEAT repeat protein